MVQSSLIRQVGTSALLVLFLLSYLHARLEFRHQRWEVERQLPLQSTMPPPKAGPLETASLNHKTLAADIIWIWAVVYYGERHTNRRIDHLDRFAETIAALDPHFHDIYPWFSTTYINANYPPTHEQLQQVNAFLERGMNQFPTDYRLPHEAGLNYIGFSAGRSDEERIEELTDGIRYLERAAKLDGAPDVLPFTISWMYQRRRQLRDEIPGESSEDGRGMSRREIEFLAEMYYLVDSKANRQRIEQMLSRTRRGKQALNSKATHYAEKLQAMQLKNYAYLPVGLWTLIIQQSP